MASSIAGISGSGAQNSGRMYVNVIDSLRSPQLPAMMQVPEWVQHPYYALDQDDYTYGECGGGEGSERSGSRQHHVPSNETEVSYLHAWSITYVHSIYWISNDTASLHSLFWS